ncbi:DUF2878 domain-containing protein [Shewanella sp. SR44-3]|uniref:DUF2878 domain-containing protein n=1 Tax=unclassified Shewanella TaxID=196818 RepID=UPI0015FB14D7|nr:DUF2878 domain-containing protein [Shewanella sp. SR44-3]MBB1269313.1 DUF2878 domain-containing protein [Shewanella sp. SR44-3]
MQKFWLINLILFQAAWFSAVLYPSVASWIMTLLLALHFYLSPTVKADAKLLILVPIGVCADKLQMHFGVFSGATGLFPTYLLLLWCFFILSLNHSLLWLTRVHLGMQGVLGALGGAGSYWAGIEAGALQTNLATPLLLCILLCIWGLLLPSLIYCRQAILHQDC